jgi:glutamate-ammonia-ligase adenylyltransferase
MSHELNISAALEMALSTDLEGDNERILAEFLSGLGFAYPVRSATNIRLLAEYFDPQALSGILEAALSAAMPDMALNNLERISSVINRSSLYSVCADPHSLSQLFALLGASPFLTNIICRDHEAFDELFIHRCIDGCRSEELMLAALRQQVPKDVDYPGIFPILRRFKYREMLRIAARDLSGLAPLEEVTAELSTLAAASLQIACEVTHRLLVGEHGAPLMTTEEGESEAEFTVLGMGN